MRSGRAYVGNFGFDLHKNETPRGTDAGHGHARRRRARRRRRPDVSRTDGDHAGWEDADRRRVVRAAPDGVRYRARTDRSRTARVGRTRKQCARWNCLDAEGAIWVACPTASEVIRVKQGGEVVERIKVETDAFACMLGGADRQDAVRATVAESPIPRSAAPTRRRQESKPRRSKCPARDCRERASRAEHAAWRNDNR